MFNILMASDFFDGPIFLQSGYKLGSLNILDTDSFTLMTFCTSCFTATYGITKFVFSSPMKLAKELAVFPSVGVFLLNYSFILRIASTDLYLFACGSSSRSSLLGKGSENYKIVLQTMWGVLPFVVNVGALMYTGGYKKTWALLKVYPQTFLSPAFSPYMYILSLIHI